MTLWPLPTLVKFSDNTVVVSLVTNNDKKAYLEDIKSLENWCQENYLLLNVSKTKESIVALKQERSYHPLRSTVPQ